MAAMRVKDGRIMFSLPIWLRLGLILGVGLSGPGLASAQPHQITFNAQVNGITLASIEIEEGGVYTFPANVLSESLAQFQDSWNALEGATLKVPVGALNNDAVININLTNFDLLNGGFQVVRGVQVFIYLEFTVLVDGQEVSPFAFNVPLIFTLPLDSEFGLLLQQAGLSLDDSLTLVYNTDRGFEADITINQTDSTLVAEIPHLSAIVGMAQDDFPQITVSIRDTSVKAGDNLRLPLLVSAPDTGALGYALTLFYDQIVDGDTVLTYQGFETEGTRTSGMVVVNDDFPNQVRFASASFSPFEKGDGVLLFIDFQVNPEAPPNYISVLDIDRLNFDENRISSQGLDGRLGIFTAYGDLTGDKTVSALDAAFVLKQVVQLLTLTLPQGGAAEVSGDGSITSLDAALILQWVVELISEFPVESEAATRVLAAQNRTSPARAILGHGLRKSSALVTVPLILQEGEGVYAATLDLGYDSGGLELVEVTTASGGATPLLEVNKNPGRVRLAVASPNAFVAGDPIVYLTFRTRKATAGPLLLQGKVRLNEHPAQSVSARIVQRFGLPADYNLEQNYPNPFNPTTTIRYSLPGPESVGVLLRVYNLRGQTITTLVDRVQSGGTFEVVWDGKDRRGQAVASGLYFYRLEVDRGPGKTAVVINRRMLLVK